MPETVLNLSKRIASEIGFPEPTALAVGSATFTLQLKRLLQRCAEDMRKRYPWPELNKDGTITLVANQESYALPDDFDYFHNETFWDRTNSLKAMGSITPREWQDLKYGYRTSARTLFRIKGKSSKQIFIYPTPQAGDAGTVLGFEYQSKSWLNPQAWTTGSTYGVDTYVSSGEYIFYSASGGVAGATAPTPSVLNDGGITWTLYTQPYESVTSDNDMYLLPSDCMALGVQWLWRRNRGFDAQEFFQEYLRSMKLAITDKNPTRDLNLYCDSEGFNYPLLPVGGWGT